MLRDGLSRSATSGRYSKRVRRGSRSRSSSEPGVKVDARSERWREHRKKVRSEIVDAAFRVAHLTTIMVGSINGTCELLGIKIDPDLPLHEGVRRREHVA
jgi:hypothetical protein